MTIKTTKDAEVKVKLDIQPGPVTPAQKQAWDRFWRRLITPVREESHSETKDECL